MNKFALLLLLIPSLIYGQNNGTFKTVRFVNVFDSTTVFPINGSIYYNEQSDKFRVYENNAWHDLLGGGGSVTDSITTSNGIVRTLNNLSLGGTISGSTTTTLGTGSNFRFHGFANDNLLYEISTGDPLDVEAYVGITKYTGSNQDISFLGYTNNNTFYDASFIVGNYNGNEGLFVNDANGAGIQYTLGSFAGMTASSYTPKNYTDTHLLSKDTPTAPTVTQNGQALRWNNGSNIWEYFTPSSSSLTSTQVAYGSGTNTVTSEAAFNYTAASNLLRIDNTSSTAFTWMAGDVFRITDVATSAYTQMSQGILSRGGTTGLDLTFTPSTGGDVNLNVQGGNSVGIFNASPTAQLQITSNSNNRELMRIEDDANILMQVQETSSGNYETILSGKPSNALNVHVDGVNNIINLGNESDFSIGLSVDVANDVITFTADGGANSIAINGSGEIIFTMTRTNCTGAPTGALANVGGTLTVCP